MRIADALAATTGAAMLARKTRDTTGGNHGFHSGCPYRGLYGVRAAGVG